MLLGNTRQFGITLARGATIVIIGSVAAGCSSGISGLTDGLTTGSTAPVTVAQMEQPYPGDTQGLRSRPFYDRIMRPKRPVGTGIENTAAALPAPGSTAPAPVYVEPMGQSVVSSTPLPPPSGSQTQLAAPSQAPSASQPVAEMAPAPSAPSSARGAAPVGGGSYTVAAGDTLYAISRKTGVGVEQIRQANALSDDGTIRVGQRLAIPGATLMAAAAPAEAANQIRTTGAVPTPSGKPAATAAKVKEPDAPKVTAYTPPAEPEKTAAESPVRAVDNEAEKQVASLPPESTGVSRLRWPARGRVVAGFGASVGGKANDGIDIAVPEGTAIHAAENGVVIYAGDGLKGFGNTVLVRHEDGLVTVYGHASDMKVKRGDNVRRGQEIALSGMTGDADSPKLHFEVRKGTTPVDPIAYLE